MRQKIKLPRIIKIEKVEGLNIQCMFNNGESRLLNFEKILKLWEVTEGDTEYPLFDKKELKKVELRNYTLSWPNLGLTLLNENGKPENHPYEVGPDILYKLSEVLETEEESRLGNIIRTARLKAGLTQEQLALRSGTSRFYISRIENNKTDVEMSTFRKINALNTLAYAIVGLCGLGRVRSRIVSAYRPTLTRAANHYGTSNLTRAANHYGTSNLSCTLREEGHL